MTFADIVNKKINLKYFVFISNKLHLKNETMYFINSNTIKI